MPASEAVKRSELAEAEMCLTGVPCVRPEMCLAGVPASEVAEA